VALNGDAKCLRRASDTAAQKCQFNEQLILNAVPGESFGRMKNRATHRRELWFAETVSDSDLNRI
jgi:hypothetical protein